MAPLFPPPLRWPLALAAAAVLLPLCAPPLEAGPVVCNTTLEAPGAGASGPVEVTRCAPVQSVPAMVQERFFTYTAPFAEGVSIRGQVRDLFGIATGSINAGYGINAFGFPDQTIIWDGTALENTYGVLLEAQSDPIPWRTVDISNGFNCSLASPAGCPAADSPAGRGASYRTPVRGLW